MRYLIVVAQQGGAVLVDKVERFGVIVPPCSEVTEMLAKQSDYLRRRGHLEDDGQRRALDKEFEPFEAYVAGWLR